MYSSGHNLYKFHNVDVSDDDVVIIDSNDRVAERIAEFTANLRQSMVDDSDPEEFADEFADGIDAASVAMLLDDGEGGELSGNVIKAEPPAPVYEGPSPEELIAEAQEQIDAMMAEAKAEAERLQQTAYDKGFAKGQAEGKAQAEMQYQQMQSDLATQAYEKEQQLIRVYQDKINEIEPALVDALTDIYQRIFHVKMDDFKNLVVHMLENTLRNIDGSAHYIIHVAKDDMAAVSMQKAELMEAGGVMNAIVDIVEDLTLKKNQCMVETENGVYDCSLGVELEELKKHLVLLSYNGG